MSATKSTVWSGASGAILAVSLGGCGEVDNGVRVKVGEVGRAGGCNVAVDFAQAGEKGEFVGVRYACGAPVVSPDEKNWWGSRSPPLAFTLDRGDCLKLEGTWYCVTEIDAGHGATLTASYRERPSGEVAERVIPR